MTKVVNLFALLFFLGTSIINAQNVTISPNQISEDAIQTFPIFSYGDKLVYNDEFMRVFNKNKQGESSPTKQEIEEYLDLYVKFKLKVELLFHI